MEFWKRSAIVFIFFICVLGTAQQSGFTQFQWGPYPYQWGASWMYQPFYSPFAQLGGQYLLGPNILPAFYGIPPGWGGGRPLNVPAIPVGPALYQRAPNATIIFTSPLLTAITASPGVILIGGTSVLGAPAPATPSAVIASAPTVQTVANPTPAPLFSLLAVLYVSGTLDGKALLTTANPLLFAYLQTLLF